MPSPQNSTMRRTRWRPPPSTSADPAACCWHQSGKTADHTLKLFPQKPERGESFMETTKKPPGGGDDPEPSPAKSLGEEALAMLTQRERERVEDVAEFPAQAGGNDAQIL